MYFLDTERLNIGFFRLFYLFLAAIHSFYYDLFNLLLQKNDDKI